MAKEKEDNSSDPHISGQSNKAMSRPAHALTTGQIIQELGADALNGLSASDAEKRLQEYGMNELGESEGVSTWKIVVAQISNAMTLVSATIYILKPSLMYMLICCV